MLPMTLLNKYFHILLTTITNQNVSPQVISLASDRCALASAFINSGQSGDITDATVTFWPIRRYYALWVRGAAFRDRIVRSHFGKQLWIAQPHLWITHAAAFGDHLSFPNLAKFACNILPLLASGYKVEREFSVLGKITMWQWSNLSTSTIANSMMCGKNLRGIWLLLTEKQKFNADLY